MKLIATILFSLFILGIDSQTLHPNIPTNGLEGYYPFTVSASDSSGNFHDGIISGTLNYSNIETTPGVEGYFNGVSYINCGDVDEYEDGNEFTFSFWCKPFVTGGPSIENQIPLASKWSASGLPAESSYLFTLNGGRVNCFYSDGITIDSMSADLLMIPIDPLYFNNLLFTFNNGVAKIYTAYSWLVAEKTLSITSINNSTADFKIGGWNYDSNVNYECFQGGMDDFFIYSREITGCEIRSVSGYFLSDTYDSWMVNHQNGGTLYSQTLGWNYQWLDCDNNYAIISGETSNSFTPTINGSYAFELSLSQDVCTDTSECVTINNVGMEETIIEVDEEIIKITDYLGREVPYKPNTPLIYYYSDGSTDRVFKVE